jgi:hypothetical protein
MNIRMVGAWRPASLTSFEICPSSGVSKSTRLFRNWIHFRPETKRKYDVWNPVIEIIIMAASNGPKLMGASLPSHLRSETNFVFELGFLLLECLTALSVARLYSDNCVMINERWAVRGTRTETSYSVRTTGHDDDGSSILYFLHTVTHND